MKTGKIIAKTALTLVLAQTLAGQIPLNQQASRALGHLSVDPILTTQPNLVEGRELNQPAAVAVDTSEGNRILYVADSRNNRVLAWQNAGSFENGAPADIVIGQRTKTGTLGLGPTTAFSSGLFSPTGVAVDSSGNLYVADAGNNRIVRYSRPFSQPDEVKLADMVIGQPSFETRGPNQAGLNERSLLLSRNTTIFVSAIAFDGSGNLWVSDAGNNRVLRYPSSALGPGAANGPAASLVLGQPDFLTSATIAATNTAANRTNKTRMNAPAGIAFDQAGRLFVCDALNRVLVYTPPFVSGMDATRLMGIQPAVAQGQTPPPPINENSLGVVTTGNRLAPPQGVFAIGNTPFVIDTPANRILRYDPFDQWPAEGTQFSPTAKAVIGQDAFQQTQLLPNRGLAEPSDSTVNSPLHAVFAGGEVYIADTNNNRVIVMGDISTGPPVARGGVYGARRVLGQIGFEFDSPNLIEGREFQFNGGSIQAGGVVFDNRVNPPRMYVADTLNHRVLGFANALRARGGDAADIVIGQPDFYRAIINFPSGEPTTPSNIGLSLPVGVAVDADGNLWVADTGNGRVMRFPDPFGQTETPRRADLVIGQASFTARQTDASSRTMSAPYGLAFSVEGSLLVSDNAHHRVLLFTPPFTSGMAADRVFGQPDFNSSAAGTTGNRFNGPAHISTDTDDRLYVADSANNRIQIFSRAPVAGTDPTAAFSLQRGVRTPVAVFVSKVTGEIWVANRNANQALRYRRFDDLTIAGDASDYSVPSGGPLALTLDRFSNLYVADALNRIAIHYPTLSVVNGANYLPRVTPGMVATMQSRQFNYSFTEVTRVFNELPNPIPIPTTIEDLQVLVNQTPSPIYFVSPFQINFLVPKDTPSSGNVEVLVQQPSTGRVVASSTIRMDIASPGLFTSNATGTGQVAAINEDGSINGTSNGAVAIERGKVITLFGTGPGPVQGAPPDGEPPSGAVSTNGLPRIIIGAQFVDPSDILYSGLAPGLVGVWQMNVRVPLTTAPSNAVLVVVVFNDIPSNNPQNPAQIRTTIAVR
ncbi:MAG: hypothetical protein R2729_11565 [Bryobacteraceae bacterium]